ncbi:MAG: hypothetical protein ACRDZX_08160 [Acidimicrobiales bacterium]
MLVRVGVQDRDCFLGRDLPVESFLRDHVEVDGGPLPCPYGERLDELVADDLCLVAVEVTVPGFLVERERADDEAPLDLPAALARDRLLKESSAAAKCWAIERYGQSR